MSAYVTQAQLETIMHSPRLADCTDDSVTGTASAAVVTDVIARASGIMDGYFRRGGYAVPLTSAGDDVKHHAGFLSAYYAAKRRPKYRTQDGKAPYHVEYDEAMTWLAKIADGEIVLQGYDPPTPGGGGAGDTTGVGGWVRHANRGGVVIYESDERKQRRW